MTIVSFEGVLPPQVQRAAQEALARWVGKPSAYALKLEDLSGKSAYEALRLKGVGRKVIERINDALHEAGLPPMS